MDITNHNDGYLAKALAISAHDGARGNTYGDTSENFTRIAELFNAYLGAKLLAPIVPEDVAALMILVKLSRIANCPTHEDSWVDIAGYVNCAENIQICHARKT